MTGTKNWQKMMENMKYMLLKETDWKAWIFHEAN